MLKLEGLVVNVYKAPDFNPKEGEKKEGGHKVQLMTDIHMKNGETKKDLVTLTVKNPDLYTVGEEASIPVGAFAKGSPVTFYGLNV
jgi:hypothetical protein